MKTAVEIGAKIAQARKLKNLSQTDLAGQMSVTSQAVGKWERGESMSSGIWKEADFSGLTGLGKRFNFSNILDCKFINSDLSTLTLNSNNLSGGPFCPLSIFRSTPLKCMSNNPLL